MGGRFGRNRAATDPFYNAAPLAASSASGYDPSGGLGAYDPNEEYGYEYVPTPSIGNMYGRPIVTRPTKYGGLYAQGLNQIPGISPWNYGNYYLGNTTMRMMPFSMNKVAVFQPVQGMGAFGNVGFSGAAPMMPSMPAIPCCMPQSYSMPPMMPSMPPMMPSMPATSCCMPQSYSMPPMMPSMPPMMPSMPPMMPSMPSMMPSMPSMMPSMPSMMPSMPSMMPSMPPIMPSMPQSYSLPMTAPMMAAASPLPVAFNPLVQGMYPMASMNPVSWMTPSSFMSALTSGPMPYRPPAFDFPSNVGMVMAIPYGTPNPLLSSPAYGGVSPSYNTSGVGGGSSWCCCYYCTSPSAAPSAPAPPSVSYYPRPVSVPQPYPVPYSVPLALPHVEQVPVPRSVSVVAPPIVAEPSQAFSLPSRDPLWPSQGAFTNGVLGQPVVLASNHNSTTQTLINNETSVNNESTKGSLPVYNPTDQSDNLIGERISSSFSKTLLNNNDPANITISKAKYKNQSTRTRDTLSDRLRQWIPSRPSFTYNKFDTIAYPPRRDPVLPPILHGELISDSGWLPRTPQSQTVPPVLTRKKRRRSLFEIENAKPVADTHAPRVSFLPRRRRHHSTSSTSEYDCAICQQQRAKRRLHEHYGSSTVSSLLSLNKEPRNRVISSNDSIISSSLYSPPAFGKEKYKPHNDHFPTNSKPRSKSSSSDISNSPVLLRKSPLQDLRKNVTIHEVDEEEEQDEEPEEDEEEVKQDVKEKQSETKLFNDDNDSMAEKIERRMSQTSSVSKDE